MNFTDTCEWGILLLGRSSKGENKMKAFSQSLIAVLVSFASLHASAGETPVFVSCYSDAGEHLQLIFDTERSEYSYRYAFGDTVQTFDAAPQGPMGASSSWVSKSIPADQQHIELKAHVIGGDVITPVFTAHVEVTFDRDETGSLKLTSYNALHLEQPVNLDSFKVGICYVQ